MEARASLPEGLARSRRGSSQTSLLALSAATGSISLHETMWRGAQNGVDTTFSEKLHVLPDEIEIDEADIGIHKLLRDRPPDLPGRPDMHPVHRHHRAQAQRSRSDKNLVGIVSVIEIEIGFGKRYAGLLREVDRGLPRPRRAARTSPAA